MSRVCAPRSRLRAIGEHPLLAAAQRAGVLAPALLEPREDLVQPLDPCHPGTAALSAERDDEVLLDGEVAEQQVTLGHVNEAALDETSC